MAGQREADLVPSRAGHARTVRKFCCCRTVPDVATAKVALGPVKLMYDSQEHFEQITGQLKMLREWKDGEPY